MFARLWIVCVLFENFFFLIACTQYPITIVAGNGIQDYSGDGGPATSAEINNVCSCWVDSIGNIFFTDY